MRASSSGSKTTIPAPAAVPAPAAALAVPPSGENGTIIRRISVTPEIAADVERHDEALAATVDVVNAMLAAGKRAITQRQRERYAALKPILLAAGIEVGTVKATRGLGADAVIEVEVPTGSSAS